MLVYINFAMIVIIVIVTIINIYYMVKTRTDLEKIHDRLDKYNPSLLDLAEFNGLDPTFKKHYRKFVVGELMPQVMSGTNDIIRTFKVNEEIEKNEYEVSKAMRDLGQEFRSGSSVLASIVESPIS